MEKSISYNDTPLAMYNRNRALIFERNNTMRKPKADKFVGASNKRLVHAWLTIPLPPFFQFQPQIVGEINASTTYTYTNKY